MGRLADEVPFWKLVVDFGLSFSEVQTWDLEDIETALAFCNMRDDHKAAYESWWDATQERKMKEARRKK